ncbi:hypothetical protein [Frondihabitans cladoniiphilus]|uniref:hypothetical protein n=1 Tax=Frondihabitans cladoniiphilus TaxID=715785 RepID=UPI0031EFD453
MEAPAVDWPVWYLAWAVCWAAGAYFGYLFAQLGVAGFLREIPKAHSVRDAWSYVGPWIVTVAVLVAARIAAALSSAQIRTLKAQWLRDVELRLHRYYDVPSSVLAAGLVRIPFLRNPRGPLTLTDLPWPLRHGRLPEVVIEATVTRPRRLSLRVRLADGRLGEPPVRGAVGVDAGLGGVAAPVAAPVAGAVAAPVAGAVAGAVESGDVEA